MEDVSAIPMHLDVVDTLRVAVAGDVAAAFDDEAAFAMSVGLMSEDSAKKTSSDNDTIPAPAERTAFFNAFAQQPFQQVRNRFLAPLAYQAKNRGKGLWKLLVKKPKEDRKPLWKKR